MNLRSSATVDPSLSLSRSITSIVNQVRNDLNQVRNEFHQIRNDFSSYTGNSPWRSPSPVYPPRNAPVPPPLPPRPASHDISRSVDSRPPSTLRRNHPSSSITVQPGDPRIGGNVCWNCFGSGKTFGFLLLSERTCDVCAGAGRLPSNRPHQL